MSFVFWMYLVRGAADGRQAPGEEPGFQRFGVGRQVREQAEPAERLAKDGPLRVRSGKLPPHLICGAEVESGQLRDITRNADTSMRMDSNCRHEYKQGFIAMCPRQQHGENVIFFILQRGQVTKQGLVQTLHHGRRFSVLSMMYPSRK